MALIPKHRKFTHSFRNKTSHLNVIRNLGPHGLTMQGQKTLYTQNTALMVYTYKAFQVPKLLFQPDLSLISAPLHDQVCKLRFGTYGIYFLKHATISAKFITSVQLNIARKLKKTARFWIMLCADTPVTARSAETRMGRGKGQISFWQSKVKPGQIFVEFAGTSPRTVMLIFNHLQKKSNVPLELIAKH